MTHLKWFLAAIEYIHTNWSFPWYWEIICIWYLWEWANHIFHYNLIINKNSWSMLLEPQQNELIITCSPKLGKYLMLQQWISFSDSQVIVYFSSAFNNTMEINNKGKVNSSASAVVASRYGQITWDTDPVEHLVNELPWDWYFL